MRRSFSTSFRRLSHLLGVGPDHAGVVDQRPLAVAKGFSARHAIVFDWRIATTISEATGLVGTNTPQPKGWPNSWADIVSASDRASGQSHHSRLYSNTDHSTLISRRFQTCTSQQMKARQKGAERFRLLGCDYQVSLYIHPNNHAPIRQTGSDGQARHWIPEIHFVDRLKQIGGFFEELLTVG